MLWTRIATAAVGIPLALLVIWVGGWPLAVVVALIAVLGIGEFMRLRRANHRYTIGFGYVLSPLLVLGAALVQPHYAGEGCRYEGLALYLAGGLASALLLPLLERRSEMRWVSPEFASMILGLFYVPFLLGYMLLLRSIAPGTVRHTPVPVGAALLFLAIGACWVTDAAAYLVGRKIGRHKLAPKISPGKTIEGGVAGLVGAVLFVGALGTWVGLPIWSAALLGVTLGVVGQLGDLFESWLKRRAGVKDSGALLPGHGGVLDRFDSLLFVAPVAYYWLHAVLAG
jgi:phosphatidate cytidylyltransferase